MDNRELSILSAADKLYSLLYFLLGVLSSVNDDPFKAKFIKIVMLH